MKYYIADTHFGHQNIIHLVNRPFQTTEEMDKTIIQNWNSVVTDNDEVYIIGDLCFRNAKAPEEYLKQLKGRKYLILGNHDAEIRIQMSSNGKFPGLIWIKDYAEIKDGDRKVILFHYPMAEWNGYFHGALHLYGHIHNNIENKASQIMINIPGAYNTGADILNFTPQTLDGVINCNKIFRQKIQGEYQ